MYNTSLNIQVKVEPLVFNILFSTINNEAQSSLGFDLQHAHSAKTKDNHPHVQADTILFQF